MRSACVMDLCPHTVPKGWALSLDVVIEIHSKTIILNVSAVLPLLYAEYDGRDRFREKQV